MGTHLLTCWPTVRNALRAASLTHRRLHYAVPRKLTMAHLTAAAKIVCLVAGVGAIGASHLSLSPPPSPAANRDFALGAEGPQPGSPIDYSGFDLPVSYVLSGLDLDQLERLGNASGVFGPGEQQGAGPNGRSDQPAPVDEPAALALFAPALVWLGATRLAANRARGSST